MSKIRPRFRPELSLLEDRFNPAQLWVSPTSSLTVLNDTGPAGLSVGDTVRVSLPGNQITDGTFGTNVFDTVESAVQAANTNLDPSNTVRVGPGTFTLSVPQLGVTKSLNLTGFGQGATTIKAGVNTTTGGASPTSDTSATVLVNRGVTLNVGSLTLDGGSGSGVDVPVLLKFTDTGTAPAATSLLNDVRVQNVGTAGGTATTAGVGVYVGGGNVTVNASTLQNIGTHAVVFRGADATGSVLGSTLTGQGAGLRVNVGVGADQSGGITVRGNVLTGFTGASGITDSAGVAINGTLLSTPPTDIVNNQFAGNRIGVSLGSLLNLSAATVISDNNFLNNTVAGISSLTSGLLPGLQNFYQGVAPAVSGLLSSGTLLSVLQPVTSTPPAGSIISVNGSISGRVVNLATGTGLANATVYIDANSNGQLDPTEVAIKTDANGNFTLSGLSVSNLGSTFRVAVVVPPGGTAGTIATNVTLNPLQLTSSGVNLNVTVPSSGGGGGGFTPLPGPGAGTPTGPGVPTDGSRLRLSAGAAGFGSAPRVTVYNPDGSVRFNFLAFAEGYKGGVRVATGDLNGDGVDDIIVGAGAGAAPHVEVFDGATGQLIRSFMAFDEGFKGGVTVAVGDLNRDGYEDIIVGAATGNSPHVKAFDALTGTELKSFFAFDQGFRGGVTVAAGDVDGDGFDEIVVGAGPGAGPHVKVFDGATGTTKLSFMAFAPEFRGGVTLAVGDVDGDGKAEIVAGAGVGGEPRVAQYDGRTGQLKRTFLAFDPGFRGGVDVGYTEANGGNVIVGAGSGGQNHIQYYDASSGQIKKSFFAWEGNGSGGISVS
ncbi:FG-GAP repeat protein [Gemmata obscuriglobus]|uniref:Uncharacterized protein n=1 Tax=Gemmata obscuriglobus TaxID=114 RepID=A0A2Z3H625_9BACT|nr:FG-GAP-like repeat-containing protein [Gemmata obscuriglobus]AWM39087.1 hypothetical protein C1280_20260 [Gemmata obscuriglobus]QEG27877.1 FG-GAP repeat protein [Gemmata obscuriglobus]VTS05280.1 Hemolysin-type calcium-binding region domain protein OS=Rhodopirellula maiorica SM1 GN=RMSM_03614 PE=4 SV=1: VCBS: VCBS [Gemmata obscuriglobus UQM 2246]